MPTNNNNQYSDNPYLNIKTPDSVKKLREENHKRNAKNKKDRISFRKKLENLKKEESFEEKQNDKNDENKNNKNNKIQKLSPNVTRDILNENDVNDDDDDNDDEEEDVDDKPEMILNALKEMLKVFGTKKKKTTNYYQIGRMAYKLVMEATKENNDDDSDTE